MRNISEILPLARDFLWSRVTPNYFHLEQPIGLFLYDRRCYLNDLRKKATWEGDWSNGIPLLRIPRMGVKVEFPIMILQYGLGAYDRYVVDGSEQYLAAFHAAVTWLQANWNEKSYLDNWFPRFSPQYPHYSANSGMAQGQALSLLLRAHHETSSPVEKSLIVERCRCVVANMCALIEDQGCTVILPEGPVLCESCRCDRQFVLNGWIFALFGLWEYLRVVPDQSARIYFESSLKALTTLFPRIFLRSDGWSYYDSRGRLASPFYQDLHAHLVGALAMAQGDSQLARWSHVLRNAATPARKFAYFCMKVREKLLFDDTYGTA